MFMKKFKDFFYWNRESIYFGKVKKINPLNKKKIVVVVNIRAMEEVGEEVKTGIYDV